MMPSRVRSWREIPPVPLAAFKEADLAGYPPEAIFESSGTSQGPARRSRHIIPWLDLYRESILPNFKAHLLPDGARPWMAILTGSPVLWPRSSLAHMMEVVRHAFGSPDSAYYFTHSGTDMPSLLRDLERASRGDRPVLLMGISPALHALIEHGRRKGRRFRLPSGSRLMDTGGFKAGRIRLAKNELYARYQEFLDIPPSHIVNEYGMTEMCSQFYDNTLADYAQGKSGGASRPRHKRIPPWVRTLVIDPETMEELPPGQTGLLRHLDLANLGSVISLQTDDLGHRIGEGFEITGRAEGAEARGCALILEELRQTS